MKDAWKYKEFTHRKIEAVLGSHLGHEVTALREDDERNCVNHDIRNDIECKSATMDFLKNGPIL